MNFSTARLCDQYTDNPGLQIAEPLLRSFGGLSRFSGQITTLKVFEESSLVEQVLSEAGEGKVLVIDGGGSRRCALLGSSAAKLACDNGWRGVIVYGCIRDSETIASLPLGLLALNTHPLKSRKHGIGERDSLITFAGVNFKKGHTVYVDSDGMIVLDTKLD